MARPKNHFPMPKKLRRGKRSNRPQNLIEDWQDETGVFIGLGEETYVLRSETPIPAPRRLQQLTPGLLIEDSVTGREHSRRLRLGELGPEESQLFGLIAKSCADGKYKALEDLETEALGKGLDHLTLSAARTEGYRLARERLSKERER